MKFFAVREMETHLAISFLAPDSRNALSVEAARELGTIVQQYIKWSKPVVVGSREPRFFCSGGNLTDYKKLKTKWMGLKINREIHRHLDRFGQWPVVKLALIEGDVLGGGMEWLARFDFRWATPSVFLSFWQRRIGLSPGWGGGRWWSDQIGDANLRRLLLEAHLLSATRAMQLGLLDEIHPSWVIRDRVAPWCRKMSGETVKTLLKWRSSSEQKIFASLWMSEEHRANLKSWKSKPFPSDI